MRKLFSRIKHKIEGEVFPSASPKKPQKPGDLYVFIRYCNFSTISQHKNRPSSFSREGCFANFVETLGDFPANVLCFLDRFHPMQEEHFILRQKNFPVISFKAGTEALSFLFMLDYVFSLSLPENSMLYFLEDDYLHRPSWPMILQEGLNIEKASYVTLFDHKDKYTAKEYQNLKAQIYLSNTVHWRSTPSTTNTYAMLASTLYEDKKIHYAFSKNRSITADHQKFLCLGKKGKKLISPIPGFSTHVESAFLSPSICWDTLQPLYAKK